MKNRRWGIRFDGLGQEVEKILIEYLQNSKNFRYYEIGTAGGLTLKSITDIVSENIKHSDWKTIGLDLINGYSLNWNEISQVFDKKSLQVFCDGLGDTFYLNEPKTRLLLFSDPRNYTKTLENQSLDIVLIDGNHNKFNVTEDFLSVESKIKVGGQVWFHDIGIEETGTDPQVGGGFIEVRQAVTDLGLFDNKRIGWKFIKEIPGSRVNKSGDGNSLGVFQKINENWN